MTECLFYIQAAQVAQTAVNYRALVPVKRIQNNRRYKDYRTMNQHKPSRQYYPPRRQSSRRFISPRSTMDKAEGKYHFTQEQIRLRRKSQWQKMVDVKRDLEMNPPPPSTEAPVTEETSPAETTQQTPAPPKRSNSF